MRIAVAFEDGEIFQHFGHTKHFKFYDLENSKITKTEVVETYGSGHGLLAEFLNGYGADIFNLRRHRFRSKTSPVNRYTYRRCKRQR